MEIVRYTKEDGTQPFGEWLSDIRDVQAKVAIRRRIDRLAMGNAGNCKALRAGVSELKIDMGPGYRVYYGQHGKEIVLLICDGDKRTQDADITRAVQYWEDWKIRQRKTS
jgi:putative addiction module killer protein